MAVEVEEEDGPRSSFETWQPIVEHCDLTISRGLSRRLDADVSSIAHLAVAYVDQYETEHVK